MLNHGKKAKWIAGLGRLVLVAGLVCLESLATANADESPTAVEPSGKPVVTQASATTSATPAGAFTLAYKFQPGQFVHYTGTSRVQYNSEVEDKKPGAINAVQKYTSVQSNETWTHFRVVTVDEQGLALIEPVIDRTRMTAKLNNNDAVSFDSANLVADTPPQFNAIREAVGRTVARFQVSPSGRLVKAVVIDATAPQALRDAAEKLDTLPYLSPLPAAAVSVGDKWREEYSITLVNDGLKQPIPMRRIFELVAVTNGIATIKFRTLVMRPLNEPELQKQIMQQTPIGTIEFHIERGLVVSHTSKIDQTTMNAFGPQSLLNVTGTSTEKLATVDEPAAKPAVIKVNAVAP